MEEKHQMCGEWQAACLEAIKHHGSWHAMTGYTRDTLEAAGLIDRHGHLTPLGRKATMSIPEAGGLKIISIQNTCVACPSQWSGKTDDGRDVYVRFRHGYGYIEVTTEPFEWERIFEWEDPDRGFINYADLTSLAPHIGWPANEDPSEDF